MGTSVDLLRMLEPTVRPTGQAPSRTAETLPLEARSFESLLEEARSATEPEPISEVQATDQTKATKSNPLAALGGLDRIENESLLRMVNGITKGN